MKNPYTKLAVIVLCVLGAVLRWFTYDASALATRVWIMPSHQNYGSSIYDGGLHFDDLAGSGAYNYSGSLSTSTPIYVRGMLPENNAFPVKYQYFYSGSTCRARARMWRLVSGSWVVDYNHDVEILHLDTASIGSGFTSQVQYSGQWFYSVLGNPGYCRTDELHLHMGMTPSAYVLVIDKYDDTCWANASECNLMNKYVGNHGPTATSCPGGQYGTVWNRSGGVGTSPYYIPYKCQEWSYRLRSPDAPAFDAH